MYPIWPTSIGAVREEDTRKRGLRSSSSVTVFAIAVAGEEWDKAGREAVSRF